MVGEQVSVDEDWIDVPGVGKLPIITLHCCKAWPIIMGLPWGYCGDCGRKPRRRDDA